MKRSAEYINANDKVTEMNTLTECIHKVEAKGYVEEFKIAEQGLYRVNDNNRFYSPGEIEICNFYRFEGESDPGDMSILFVIETNDGIRGTLVDAFGMYSDIHLSQFIPKVTSIKKETA
jgi:hypothetical protein